MLVNTLFYEAVDELLNVIDRLAVLMAEARVPYEIGGGMAVFLHVRAVSKENARLTNDVDKLIDARTRKAKGAVQFVLSGEKVRPDYLTPVPGIDNPQFVDGIRLAPVADLVQMKLTSNRLKDMTHVRDLLNVGLITPEIEASLPSALRERLEFIKAHE